MSQQHVEYHSRREQAEQGGRRRGQHGGARLSFKAGGLPCGEGNRMASGNRCHEQSVCLNAAGAIRQQAMPKAEAVPRFYFHLRSDIDFVRDEEGREFPSLADARTEALAGAADILASELKEGKSNIHVTAYVDDDRGARLLTISLAATVQG